VILLIDLGNTRLKWSVLEKNKLTTKGELVHVGQELSDVLGGYDEFPNMLERVVISSVAGSQATKVILEFFKSFYALKPEFVTVADEAFGVKNSYVTPDRLGVDRWVAMIGAFAEFGGSVCIVDAGTAITVDSLDESGRHLGGVIAPGYRLMLGSLASGTSDLDPNAAPPEALAGDIFATDTLPAIQRGAAYAMAALVDRAVTEAEKSFSSGSHVILTGGDAGMIQPLLEHDSKLVADLILRGLAVFARN